MNRMLKAIGLGAVLSALTVGGVSAIGCNSSGQSNNCIDCQSLNCNANQIAGWCLVDILDAKHNCHFDKSFGYCLTLPDAGFPPNTNINNWVWQIMYVLIKPMIANTFGTSVGYDMLECKAGATNPYYGQFMTNSYVSPAPLNKIVLDTPDSGFRVEDEASCEACASAQCDLTSCAADANCICWVSCSFSDPSLASCPGMCGAFGAATTALVSCLDTTCGEACGVTNNMSTCNPSQTGTGAGGSPTTCTLQQGGMDCNTDADCCSGQCVGSDGVTMGTCA